MLALERAQSAVGILRQRLARQRRPAESLEGAPQLLGGRDPLLDVPER